MLLESGVAGLRSSPLILSRFGSSPLCGMHHRASDTGWLEPLPHLEPRWRTEVAHAVLHLGLVGAYYRLGRRRA